MQDVCGWSRRTERGDVYEWRTHFQYLLCHEFHRKKFIVPDKQSFKKDVPVEVDEFDVDNPQQAATNKSTKGRRKPAYAGGLVLEPKKVRKIKEIILFYICNFPRSIRKYSSPGVL